jgi:toxin ParE1/3/4
MLPVFWHPQAEADLPEIIDYIAERNPMAAEHLFERMQNSVWPLSEHPYPFKNSTRVPGCREIVVHPNDLLIYKVKPDHVLVLKVAHARQRYPGN